MSKKRRYENLASLGILKHEDIRTLNAKNNVIPWSNKPKVKAPPITPELVATKETRPWTKWDTLLIVLTLGLYSMLYLILR